MSKFLFVLLALVVLGTSTFGQTWSPLGTGVPVPDVALGDEFGTSVSLDGNVALVGAPRSSDYAYNQGKAVIFEKVANVWTQKASLSVGTTATDMLFGSSVLLKGNYAFVGAPRFTAGGELYVGAVFVFKNVSGTWSYDSRIDCPYPDYTVFFGTSMAMEGNNLVIGAPGAYGAVSGSGAAFLFDFSTGTAVFQSRIQPASGTPDDKFGYAVAIDASNVFVGSPGRKVGNEMYAGAVFVFNLSGPTQVAELNMAEPKFAQFGSCLSVSGNQLAVSAPYITNPNSTFGLTFIFLKPGPEWADGNEDFTFAPPPGVDGYGLYGASLSLVEDHLVIGGISGDKVDLIKRGAGGWGSSTVLTTFTGNASGYQPQYGFALAFSTTDLLIGDLNRNEPGLSAGVVFTYQRSGPEWDSYSILNLLRAPSINASGDEFGRSVDIKGNYAVVGAPYDDTNNSNSGAAYVFQFNGSLWQRVAKLTPALGQSGQLFGSAVSITDDRIVVSAPMAQQNGSTSGLVYIFEKPTLGWSDMTESGVLSPVAPTKPGWFGYEVSAVDNTMVISHFNPGGSSSYGQVYVYEKSGSTWMLKATLNPPSLDDSSADGFGSVVKFTGAEVILGVSLAANRAGLVYVFEKPAAGWVNTSTPTATLQPSDPTFFGRFGERVAFHENTILTRGRKSGYVFVKQGAHWANATENAKLIMSLPDPGLYMVDLALSQDNAIISGSLNNIGLVFFYRKQNGQWMNTAQYTYISGPSVPDELGSRLALSNDHLLIANPIANTSAGGFTGAVNFSLKQPTVLSVTSTSADGIYLTGQQVNVRVKFSHAITLTGSPTLELGMYDASTRSAQLVGVSGDAIDFSYTVALNDSTPDLNYTNELALKGTFQVKSAILTTEPAITTLPLASSPYSLGNLKNLVLDGIFNKQVTGIETTESFSIKVYPNPARDILVIEGDELRSYDLWSSSGARVAQADVRGNLIEVASLSAGLYLLRITTRHGSQVVKFIKEP